MDIQILNPTERPEWDASLLACGDHSFFHTSAWARVLERTYRFKPVYFVGHDRDRAVFLMPMMGVHSLLTGKRGVSLPFTDHCPLYAPAKEDFLFALPMVIEYGMARDWRYIEWRGGGHFDPAVSRWEEFYAHDIDLERAEGDIFDGLSDNNRRNIRKARREGVSVRLDRTRESLRDFTRLNLLTRKRHGIPPQPMSFFENVYEFVIAKDYGVIASASYKGDVIASSVFFHFGREAVYKYGASNMNFQFLRPNNLLMWEACVAYARQGFRSLNLGRTDPRDEGLLRYKRAWGARETLIGYHRYDIRRTAFAQKRPGRGLLYPMIFSRMPAGIARIIGRLAYRHVG